MANIFKSLTANDIAQTRSILNAAVPIDGKVVNWDNPYGSYPANTNVKSMPNGMFQRIYDYVYTASSANHIFDITLGVHTDSIVYDTSSTVTASPFAFEIGGETWTYDSTIDAYGEKKNNIYNMLAQVLMGFDENGDIRKFDADGNFTTTGDKYNEIMAINFSRMVIKDEIKKGSFSFMLGMSPKGFDPDAGTDPEDTFTWTYTGATDSYIKISDYGAATNYKVNSPAGEYAILYAQNVDSAGTVYTSGVRPLQSTILDSDFKVAVGLIFYQAGVAIITPWLFAPYDASLWTAGKYGYLSSAFIAHYSYFRTLYDNTGSYTVTTAPNNFYSILNHLCGYLFTSEMINAVADRDFSSDTGNWTGTNWAVGGGDLTHTAGNTAAVVIAAPNIDALTGGTQYLVSFTITGATTGTLIAKVGTTAGATITIASAANNGRYHQKIAASMGATTISFTPSNDFDGSLEDVSLCAITDSGVDNDITIDDFADAYRQRFYSIDFVNSTELNSTIYFCRLNHNDFNYSANPTYTTDSKINVKQTSSDLPVAYVTGVELYSPDGEMMARGKFSVPKKKDAATSFTVRARLDY